MHVCLKPILTIKILFKCTYICETGGKCALRSIMYIIRRYAHTYIMMCQFVSAGGVCV